MKRYKRWMRAGALALLLLALAASATAEGLIPAADVTWSDWQWDNAENEDNEGIDWTAWDPYNLPSQPSQYALDDYVARWRWGTDAEQEAVIANMPATLYPARENGLWGYIDRIGCNILLDFQWLSATPFSAEGVAQVSDENGTYQIDMEGKRTTAAYIAPQSAGESDSGACWVEEEGSYHLVDGAGVSVAYGYAMPPVAPKDLYTFHEGFSTAAYYADDVGCYLYQYVDETGKLLLQGTDFTRAYAMRDGMAMVEWNGLMGYVDKYGNVVYREAELPSLSIADQDGYEAKLMTEASYGTVAYALPFSYTNHTDENLSIKGCTLSFSIGDKQYSQQTDILMFPSTLAPGETAYGKAEGWVLPQAEGNHFAMRLQVDTVETDKLLPKFRLQFGGNETDYCCGVVRTYYNMHNTTVQAIPYAAFVAPFVDTYGRLRDVVIWTDMSKWYDNDYSPISIRPREKWNDIVLRGWTLNFDTFQQFYEDGIGEGTDAWACAIPDEWLERLGLNQYQWDEETEGWGSLQ